MTRQQPRGAWAQSLTGPTSTYAGYPAPAGVPAVTRSKKQKLVSKPASNPWKKTNKPKAVRLNDLMRDPWKGVPVTSKKIETAVEQPVKVQPQAVSKGNRPVAKSTGGSWASLAATNKVGTLASPPAGLVSDSDSTNSQPQVPKVEPKVTAPKAKVSVNNPWAALANARESSEVTEEAVVQPPKKLNFKQAMMPPMPPSPIQPAAKPVKEQLKVAEVEAPKKSPRKKRKNKKKKSPKKDTALTEPRSTLDFLDQQAEANKTAFLKKDLDDKTKELEEAQEKLKEAEARIVKTTASAKEFVARGVTKLKLASEQVLDLQTELENQNKKLVCAEAAVTELKAELAREKKLLVDSDKRVMELEGELSELAELSAQRTADMTDAHGRESRASDSEIKGLKMLLEQERAKSAGLHEQLVQCASQVRNMSSMSQTCDCCKITAVCAPGKNGEKFCVQCWANKAMSIGNESVAASSPIVPEKVPIVLPTSKSNWADLDDEEDDFTWETTPITEMTDW